MIVGVGTLISSSAATGEGGGAPLNAIYTRAGVAIRDRADAYILTR